MTEQFLKEIEPKSSVEFAQKAAADQANANQTLLGDMWNGIKYQGVQVPVMAVGQIVGRDWKFMDTPKNTESFGFQLGGAIGMMPSFLATHYAVGKASSRLFGKAETLGVMSMRRAVGEMATTGALYEGVFMPSSNEDGLLLGRMKNAGRGALTFGTLAAGAKGLHDFTALRHLTAPNASLGARLLGNATIGTVSGFPAGMVGTQADSLLNKGQFASLESTLQGGRGFAMVGGVLGAAHTFVPTGRATEAGKQTEGAKPAEVQAETARPAVPSDKVVATEFTPTDPALARAQIDALRSGKKAAEFDVIHENGAIGRLLMQHEAPLSPVQLARVNWVAMCNSPAVLGRVLANRGFAGRDVYLTEPNGRIRLSTERESADAYRLGLDKADFKQSLAQEGISVDAQPRWLSKFEVEGKLGSGDQAVVYELTPKPDAKFGKPGQEPVVVLKIIRSGEVENKPYNAQTYDATGRATRSPEAMFEGSDGSTWFLESKVDFSDVSGKHALETKLKNEGLYISDAVGSGEPVGIDVNTGKTVVADRNAVSRIGSGDDQVLQTTQERIEEVRALEENAPEAGPEGRVFDIDVEQAAARKVERLTLKGDEQARVEQAFGPDAVPKLQEVIKDVTNGMAENAQDVVINQLYLRNAATTEAQAHSQIKVAIDIAKRMGLALDEWARKYKGK